MVSLEIRSLLQSALIWDAHVCLPLHPAIDLEILERHRRLGVNFVSINVGMDMNPRQQILELIESFTEQLDKNETSLIAAKTIKDVETAHDTNRLAVAFDLEGGVPLDGRPEEIDRFYRLGVRQIHLAYNRNNELCGGCYDDDIPLSKLGREVVTAINEAGMLMDCSHTGHRSSLDIMEQSTTPVIFSHANARALHEDGRNITNEQIDACAATGGVICVNGVGRFLGDLDGGTPSILKHIEFLVERVGPKHVGLGIDFEYPENGLSSLPEDTDRDYWWPPAFGYQSGLNVKIAVPEQIPDIIEGLVDLGYDEQSVRAIAGGNMLRVATQVWK